MYHKMSRAKGNIAEKRAVEFLKNEGFCVVEQNFYSRFGEIDVIVSRENILHFVEVKSGEDFELAVQNMTPSKISKIIKTAEVYMKKNAFDGEFCIDAIIVTPKAVEIVENITL